MEEEDSSGVAWPHDLLLLRDAARAQLRQLNASEVYVSPSRRFCAALCALHHAEQLRCMDVQRARCNERYSTVAAPAHARDFRVLRHSTLPGCCRCMPVLAAR